jgi:ABC-type dipeptide/oligopeptide/nickel transport system permease subunit
MLKSFLRNTSAIIGAALLVMAALAALFASYIAPYDPIAQDTANRLQAPSPAHWLGTDDFGRDILSRIIYGTRTSIAVGVIATAVGLMAGASLGVFGGFRGGRTDQVIMRAMDVMLSFPSILMAILIMALLGPSLMNLVIAIGLARVPLFARLSRSVVLSVRASEYVEAAVSLGSETPRIIVRHVLPNITAPLVVQGTATLAEAIVTAAALNFLGLGIQPPTPDWGAMVSDGRRFIFDHPYIPLFPGLAITGLVLSLNLVGDWLRDALDPRLRGYA